MRAAYITAKEDLQIRTVDTPDAGADQVRIRIDYVGICGSDLHYYYEGANGAFVVREPLIPGHEVSGRIDHDPRGEWPTGRPVTIHPARFGTPAEKLDDYPHLWAGGSYLGSASTWPHTQGGMAEMIIVERSMVRVLPETLPVRRAVLAEPLAVALHALHRAIEVSGDIAGQRVLVSGSGPIGLLMVAAVHAYGAASVAATDVLAEPLERARAVGADTVYNVMTDDIAPNSYDVVFECSGVAPAISTAFVAARPAGTVIQVGMVPAEPRPINLAPAIAKELTVRGTFRFRDEIDEAVQLLADNPAIEQVITHEFSLDDTVAAFAAAKDSAASGKVVVAL